MNDSNRMTKWVMVIVLVVLAMVILYPPSEKLKGGIDLVGGTSLLYEVDTTGLEPEDKSGLSAKVIRILKERVDPNGQMNLEWRPVGNTRLEVRMPRPPAEARARREVYDAAKDRIREASIVRFDVESALNSGTDRRQTLLDGLVRGIDRRKPFIDAVASAFDAQQTSSESGASGETAKAYEEAMSALLATSMRTSRLTDVLSLPTGPKRDEQLARLRKEFAEYDAATGGTKGCITEVVEAYDAWAKNKTDLEDPEDLKRRLRGAGVLEFRILANRDAGSPMFTQSPNDSALRHEISRYTAQLAEHGPRPQTGDRYGWFAVSDVVGFTNVNSLADWEAQKNNPNLPIIEEYVGRYYVLTHIDREYGLLKGTGKADWSLRQAFPNRDPLSGRSVVSFTLDPRGGRLFGKLTGDNIDRWLCIMLDNSAMSFAEIQGRITERGQISGGAFTDDHVQELVRFLEAGSLPARLRDTPLMENTIGPSLGEANRTKGISAAIYGTIAVLIFVLFYYGLVAGGLADIALVMNLLFVLAAMALLQATFTLPGIAGLILTVGMAVDANVLILERIREERDRGVVFKRALNAGYDKAFSTIMDANITTLITCVILGFVGSEEIKGFAITLGIGITTSMFTSLFVTRLVFNTLIAKGWLKDLSMRRWIGQPSVDWMALRTKFWPASIVVSVSGLALFVGISITHRESMFDIEFLGGTSLQIDLKPDVSMTDDEMTELITGDGQSVASAASWLDIAADQLEQARAVEGDSSIQFRLTSTDLAPVQLVALMQATIESRVVRNGARAEEDAAVFDAKPGQLNLEQFRQAVADAAKETRVSATRLRGARVQSVGGRNIDGFESQSYEIVTVDTNRVLIQTAVVATLGDDLSIQRSIRHRTVRDDELTMKAFFVVESSDRYLSDVIGGDANFDIRRFRGGAAIVVELDKSEQPLPVEELRRRTREVGLQPEFERYATRESVILPLGAATTFRDGRSGYRKFAVVATDDSLHYDDDRVRWEDSLAEPQRALVQAALGQEKSLSKVIQFSAPIAEQTRNQAMFAIVLAFAAIVSYLWLRFGTKEYGLAAIVALAHDVSITLGLVAVSQMVANTFVGRALMLDAFRIDLPMIAAILTVIGYSLNDTIVVFDRIRENKGRSDTINPRVINTSINQTLSRTLITSLTTLLVVGVLYFAGGKGVHGFSFALIIGVFVGTYSSIAIATPLLQNPKLLHTVVTLIGGFGGVGIALAAVPDPTARLVVAGLAALACMAVLIRIRRADGYVRVGQAVPA